MFRHISSTHSSGIFEQSWDPNTPCVVLVFHGTKLHDCVKKRHQCASSSAFCIHLDIFKAKTLAMPVDLQGRAVASEARLPPVGWPVSIWISHKNSWSNIYHLVSMDMDNYQQKNDFPVLLSMVIFKVHLYQIVVLFVLCAHPIQKVDFFAPPHRARWELVEDSAKAAGWGSSGGVLQRKSGVSDGFGDVSSLNRQQESGFHGF